MNFESNELASHRQIANLIEALDSPGFWVLLMRAVRTAVEFDNWVILRFSNNARPAVFLENLPPEGTTDLLFQDYLNGLYQFDPFYIASRSDPRSGMFLLDEVAPENFANTDYYRLYFHLNIVADEIQFNCAMDGDSTVCFSIGRGSRYTASEIAALSVIAPWVIALMQQRRHFERSAEAPGEKAQQPNWHDDIERAISRAKGTKLTGREVEISQFMLSGFSSKSIAAKLDISVETVRAHRKHIYNKLNINSQSELFAIFYQAQASDAAAERGSGAA